VGPRLAPLPVGRLEAGIGEARRELAADRNLDADDVDAIRDSVRRLTERCVDDRLGERRADPRPRGVAEQPDELATRRSVGVDPSEGGGGQASRLFLGDLAPVELAEELALE